MPHYGKKYELAKKLINPDTSYELSEAIELLIKTQSTKFDSTAEIHFHLGIDPRQSDQLVRSTITLPNGTGKTKRVAAFSDMGNEKELMSAGAVVAG
jgi:large subunit ribosomal protein L1